ncbi:MAG: thiol:disulfide interchange protein DsbA/DsbL [Gammaproteobacteria bacterium]|nr:MAG: thiol:disulfide interchange protein DsbA/DsbL [Gammaproteobacteria bacterium]
MNKFFTLIFMFVVLSPGMLSAAPGEGYAEGFEYKLVTPAQPTTGKGMVEVVEMFWYGCPHCFKFEPILNEWLKTKPKNVKFVRVPAIFRPQWELHAQLFYTAEALGIADKLHQQVFDAIHKERINLSDEKSIRTFFVKHGVKAEDFDRTFRSFSVLAKVRRARMLTSRYGINVVPSMIVNGKYMTDARIASLGDTGITHQNMLKVVDFLIARESSAGDVTTGNK